MAVLTLFVLTALWLPGCFSYHRAQGGPAQAELLPADAWVRPDAEALRPLAGTPSLIRRYEVDRDGLTEDFPQLTPEQLDLVADKAVRLHAVEIIESRLTEGGLIRLWHDTRNPESDTRRPLFFNFRGRIEKFVDRGAFLTPDHLEWRMANEGSRERHGLEERTRSRGTDVRAVTITDETARWRLREGYSLGFSFPDGEPVGLVIHLTSLFENKYEHAVVRRLKRWGWAVGHVETQLSVRGPLAERAMDRRNEREALLESRMPFHPPEFTERVYAGDEPSFAEMSSYVRRRHELGEELKKDLSDLGTGFELGPDSDPEAIADAIAAAVDLKLSEHADAVAALVESLDRMHPELAGRPLLVTGFSAGALAAPAVAARLRESHPDRPVLLLLAGGGGTLLEIAQGSTLTNGGIRLKARDGPDPTPEQLAALQSRYESRSRLDPIRAAAALRDIPVLHIYAGNDTVIPTAAAERFNAAHGSVDRMVHRGNHDTLLFFLNSQAGRIRSWLRSHGVE